MDNVFQVNIFADSGWFDGFEDFSAWLAGELQECKPKGPCGQLVYITSGLAGLEVKYPTFEAARTAWEETLVPQSSSIDDSQPCGCTCRDYEGGGESDEN